MLTIVTASDSKCQRLVLEFSERDNRVPRTIEQSGFYEGRGTPYRVEPKDIIKVLDFLKPSTQKK